MSSKPKDHTKTIATMKSTINDLKKNINKITKEREKEAEKATEREGITPEEHQAAMQHFANMHKLAKMNKDDVSASAHARAYHDYANKLSAIYQKKIKEDVNVCVVCEKDPCECDDSHGFVNESELGDHAHAKTLKHRFLVTYSDPHHTVVSKRKEKQQKHVLVPSSKDGQSIYKGEAEPLVKKYMKKQGYKVHDLEHVGMVSKKIHEGKMGEKAAGDLDFHPEIKNDDPPFDKPYKRSKGTITDKSGAKHTALSRVRDLARRSIKKEGYVPDHSGQLNKSDASTMSKVAALMAKEKAAKAAKKPVKEEKDITKWSTDKLQKHWDTHKDEERPAPVFAAHLKQVAKELAKRKKPVKEDVNQVDEAVKVDKKNYSWGKMITVHHGADTSFPLHPEHQKAIKKLRPGMKTTFKDETGRQIHAHREGDNVHLTHHNTGSSTATKTTVGYHHFDESTDVCPVCGQTPCNCTNISETTNPYKLHEIKMSGEDEAKYNVDYGKRATKLLKHSWSQHDVSKEKTKTGDKEGAEKASKTGSRAHKLFIKARDKHLAKPANAAAHIKKIMSGASDYYKSKKPGEYTGD